MSMEIFKLVGSIFVDSEEANKSISKTDEKAGGLADKFLKGVGTAAKWGAGIAAAAGAGATALLGVANKAASAMDVIDKGSAKVGISKQAYQEWSYVLGQNGMDIGKLEVGMKTLTSKMDAAASGTKSAQEAFDALGVTWEDGNGKLKDQETMMNEALYALADMENGTEKARLATELFGKAGVEMMPMLNNGAEGMADLTQRAHDLGLVVSDEAVSAGVLLGDTMDDVKQSFGAVVTKIGVEALPIIQSLLDWLLEQMPTIQAVLGTVFEVVTTGVTAVIDFISYLTEIVQAKLPEIQEVVGTVVAAIIAFWNEHLKPCVEAIASFIQDVLAPAFKAVFENIILPCVEAAFKGIQDLWEGSLKPILTGIVDFITGVFTGDWQKAFDGLSSIVSGVFQGMITLVKTPINAIIGMVNKFIDGLNKLSVPDWVPGIGGKGINIPEIPLLAKGGTILKSGKAIVGESGAELVDLPAGATVRPLSGMSALSEDPEGLNEVLSLILELLRKYLPQVGSSKVYLNGGTLVGELVPEIDRKLERRKKDTRRGSI